MAKLLELRDVVNHDEHYIAFIQLTVNQERVDLKWELDVVTGLHLSKLIKNEINIRYRLSLQVFKVADDHYVSSFNRVSGESSEKIVFNCTESYAKNIQWVKEIDEMNTVLNHQGQASEPNTTQRLFTFRGKKIVYKKMASVVGVAILITALTFSANMNSAYSTKQESQNKFNETVALTGAVAPTANPVISGGDIPLQPLSYSDEIPDVSSPSSIPVIELEDSLTYSLPEGYVALTFDDGPSKYTKQIVDLLDTYEVGGTFFFVGSNVNKYSDSIKYAFDHGYAIGNHSMTHARLNKITDEAQITEIIASNELIEAIIDEPVRLFRPPYGALNDNAKRILKEADFKAVLWDRDAADWENRDSDTILNYVMDSDSSGSIYLFHELEATVNALPGIIEHLRSQGLKIANLK